MNMFKTVKYIVSLANDGRFDQARSEIKSVKLRRGLSKKLTQKLEAAVAMAERAALGVSCG